MSDAPAIADLDALDAAPHERVFADPKTVLLELDAGESVPEHSHPGTRIVCHVLDGEVAMTVDDETYDLGAGDCLRFSGESRISPTASEDARALLVFAGEEET